MILIVTVLAIVVGPALLVADDRPLDITTLGAPSFESFSQRDGLPDGVMTAIGVDAGGAAIASAPSGLYRFVGHRWQQQVGTEHGTIYRRFFLDHTGVLWTAANDKDVAFEDGSGWHFLTYPNELPTSDVYRVSETRDARGGMHTFLVTSAHGIFERHGRRWLPDPGNPSLPQRAALSSFAETSSLFGERRQWVGTGDSGLWYRREGEPGWHSFAAEGLDTGQIEDIQTTVDRDGESLWLCSYGRGVYRLTGRGVERWSVENGELPTNQIYAMTLDQDPQLGTTVWVPTRSGLVRIRGGVAVTFDRRYGLPSDQIRATALWRSPSGEKVLWIATEAGVARAVFTSARWQTASLMGSGAVGVFGVFVEDGPHGERLWVAANRDGLGLYEEGKWRRFSLATGDLPGNDLRMVKRVDDLDGKSALWIGMEPGYLLRVEEGPRFVTIHTPWPHGLGQAPMDILNRTFEGKREIWIATRRSGIYRWRDGAWTSFRAPEAQGEWRAVSLVEQIDGTGRSWLWAATNQGLARYDGHAWTLLTNVPGLTTRTVLGVTFPERKNPRQILWAGTDADGLIRLDVTNPLSPFVRPQNEVPPRIDVTIYSALADHRGQIYLATNTGVQRLTPTGSGWRSTVFRRQEGMVHEECNANAQFIDRHDRYWTGTLGGVTVYEPGPAVRGIPKKLCLVDVRVDGRSVNPTALEIPPRARELKIEYTLETWQRESETRYRTRIIGFDPAPTPWTPEPTRTVTSLPPGSYSLRVEARDYSGVEGIPLEMKFRVIPAWWQKTFVRAGFVLCFLLLIPAGAQWRTRALRARTRRLEEEVAVRTEQLHDANARLLELSYTDSLTGLANRRRFHEHLREMLAARGANGSDGMCSLAFIDVDHFKKFNDHHGHPAGDEALRTIAASLAACSPQSAIVARYGGEEFACLLPGVTVDDALRIGERMRIEVMRRPIAIPGRDDVAYATISAGVAAAPLRTEGDIHELLRVADAALYRAKSDGRNCVRA